MRSDISSGRPIRRTSKAARLSALVVLVVGFFMTPTAALAGSGSSATLYGCKGTYSGKVAVGNCNPAGKTMSIKILGDCSGAQSGYDSGFKSVKNGSTYTPYASASCIWNVTSIDQAVS